MNINKVTDDENHNLFLADLLSTTKKHHKRKYIIHLKCNSGAEMLIMTRKSYITLTAEKFFKNLMTQMSTKRIWSQCQHKKSRISEVVPMERQTTL